MGPSQISLRLGRALPPLGGADPGPRIHNQTQHLWILHLLQTKSNKPYHFTTIQKLPCLSNRVIAYLDLINPIPSSCLLIANATTPSNNDFGLCNIFEIISGRICINRRCWIYKMNIESRFLLRYFVWRNEAPCMSWRPRKYSKRSFICTAMVGMNRYTR